MSLARFCVAARSLSREIVDAITSMDVKFLRQATVHLPNAFLDSDVLFTSRFL